MRNNPPLATLIVPFLAILLAGCPFTRPDDESDGGTVNRDGGDGGGQVGEEGLNAPGTCGDGFDNDEDGFTDCQDFGCTGDTACEAPDSLSIYDIQDASSAFHPAVGDTVTLAGVVVTAVRSSGQKWDAYIQEKDGGPFSGIQLFGSPVSLAIGDEVDVTGQYDEYFDMSQVKAVTVTVKQQGVAVPAPAVVSPAAVATGGPDAEKYESVLVVVEDVAVTETPVPGTDGTDRGDYRVTGGLIVGHYWRNDYQSARTLGDEFQAIVGVLTFSFSEMRLEPRGNADLTFKDGTHPGPKTLTIQSVQNPGAADHPAANSGVSMSGLVVTAKSIADNQGRVHLAVQDPAGGEWSGIYVYNAAKADVSGIQVGDAVTVAGTYVEFSFNGDTDTVSELSLSTIERNGPGTVPTARASDVATLTTAATAEPWEGCLVEVTNVTVSAATNNYGEFTLAGGLKVDDLFVGPTMGSYSAGDTFNRITGFLHWNFGWTLVPRTADDLAPGTIAGPTEATVQDVQGGAVTVDTRVRITGAVVTAVQPGTTGIKALVIQQGSGALSGLWVNVPAAHDPGAGAIEVGDLVTVEGTYIEYFDMSEIKLTTPATVTGTATLPVPEVLEPTVFSDPTTAEPWEGVLVKIEKAAGTLAVDAAPDTYGEFKLDGVLAVDDTFYAHPATAAEQLQSVTGIIDYAFSHFRVLPRAAADVVK